jgi:hypothetical protein
MERWVHKKPAVKKGRNQEMKKLVMVALVLSLMLPLMANEGQAAPTWYYCNVLQVGPDASGGWFILQSTDGSFATNWYPIAPGSLNTILATALTAVANSKTARAYFDPGTAPSTVTGLIIVQ